MTTTRTAELAAGATPPCGDMFRTIVETAPVAMAVICNGRCILANRAFGDMRGCAGTGCGKQCDSGDFLPIRQGPDWETVSTLLQESGEIRKHLMLKDARGHPEEAEVILRGFHAEGRECVLLTVREAGKEARMRRLVDHLAFHDSLTELPNRALFFDRLSQALARARREDWGFALMILDLDGFKEINDGHGHGTGDELLHAAGRRLAACVRDSDTVARLGGDEFALLLHGIRSGEEAEHMARKVLRRLADPFDLGKVRFGLGASIGIALCPAHGTSLDSLLAQADRAMYRTKQDGKNGHALADGLPPDGAMPVRMPWVCALALGHETLDIQHAGLAEAINAIIEAMANGHERALLEELLARLEWLAREHFEHEEMLMAQHGHEDLAGHRACHQRLLSELPVLASQVWSGAFTTTVQALQKWLMDHMRNEDRELVSWLRARAEA